MPRWSGAECPRCADPVEIVVLDNENLRVRVNRAVNWQAGTIAARLVGPQLHGYRITKTHQLVVGHQPFRLHEQTCTEGPPPPHEQPPLFTTEGTV